VSPFIFSNDASSTDMKKIYFVIAAILVSVAAKPQQEAEKQLTGVMHSISSHDLMDYVTDICDNKYEGRLTGTEGYARCAEWLAGKFSEFGLSPSGDEGSWFQWFKIPYTLVYPDCGVSLEIPLEGGGSLQKKYRYIDEFMPGSTSGNGEITAEVIYAGYGITAPELGYDDYAGTDVKGKIILIEREAPVSPDAGHEKFDPWYKYSFHQEKLENAVKHGAAGMLYNYGPIANPNNAWNDKFIYAHIGDSVVRDIFSGTGKDHDEIVRKINTTLKPASFNTKKRASVKMSTMHYPDGKGCNIIGIIKGSDPVLKDEVIIIGAHLDGLGRCWEIIPGANDNASAVAVLMGVAKALVHSNIKMKRSVLFLAFGAEEQAIMGSKAYLEHPAFKPEKSVLLNMDGVGIGESIGANAGRNYPVLWAFIEDANNSYIHRTVSTGYFSNLGRPRLDAARFMSAGIPSLSFYTYGSENYYHLPLDNIKIIKPEIMEDMAQLLLVAVVKMANSEKSIR
jgi:hypothetical protein